MFLIFYLFFFKGTNRQLKDVYENSLNQQIKGYDNVFNLRRQNEYLMITNIALKNRLRNTPFTFVEINKHIERHNNPLEYLNVFYNQKSNDFHISFIPFIYTIIHKINIGLTVNHIKTNSYLMTENIINNNWKSMVEIVNKYQKKSQHNRHSRSNRLKSNNRKYKLVNSNTN